MIWTACALAVLLAMPVLAAQAVEEELSVYEENQQLVAQKMVERAMTSFGVDGEGTVSLMREQDNLLFRDGNVYAFLLDNEGVFLAHASMPGLVGSSIHDETDSAGINLGNLFESNSSPWGGWVRYEGHSEGPVKAWLRTGGGHTFGAAIHLDENARTEIHLTERDRERRDVARAMVEQAIETFLLDPDLVVSMIHDPDDTLFRDDELYAVIIHNNGTILAHGDSPNLAGTDMGTIADSLGANLWDVFEENESVYGRWVEFYWPDPRVPSDEGELKMSWVRTSGEYKFSVGIYPEDPDVEHDDLPSHHDSSRKDAAVRMMERTIQIFANDRDRAISFIHNGDNLPFHDSELYPIVADQNGVVVAHGNDPGLASIGIGDVSYADGTTLEEILASGSPYGNWVEHQGVHPVSGEQTLQKTLVKHHGGHMFAIGTYPEYVVDYYPDLTIEELERMAAARNVVEHAAESFAIDPDATILAIHSLSDGFFRDKEIFVSITHRNGTIMAHGYSSTIAGTDIEYLRDTRGASIGDLLEDNISVYGRWVEYYWPNPDSIAIGGEPTLVWYKMFGEHIFGAGTYPDSIK